jgi:hypothetical protein
LYLLHSFLLDSVQYEDVKAFIINIGTVYYGRYNLYTSCIPSPCIAQSICTAETKILYRCVAIWSCMIVCYFVIFCVIVLVVLLAVVVIVLIYPNRNLYLNTKCVSVKSVPHNLTISYRRHVCNCRRNNRISYKNL